MDHQLQELFDFGLKNFGFCMCLIGHNFRIDLIVMIEQKNGFSGYLGAHEPISSGWIKFRHDQRFVADFKHLQFTLPHWAGESCDIALT